MRNINITIICFLLVALLPTASLAKVTASINRTSMAIDETLSLTLTKDSTSFFSSPDLAPLEKDFRVLGQSQSSTTQIINGATTSKVEWNIVLEPRRTGRLQIPPVSVGKEQSNPLRITVTKAGPPKQAGGIEPIFIETEVDTNSVHVQSQVIFTLKLYWAVDMRIADPADPQIKDALVKRLNDASYDKMINDQAYRVFERKYAIFPQKSGSIEIPPITIEATVQSRRRSHNFFDPFGTMGEKIRLRSEPVTIGVFEKPPEYPATDVWLPASLILLKEQWNNGSQDLTAGDSTTVTVTLTAEGLTGEQLPPVKLPEIEGLKLYQGKAEVENTITDTGVVGTRRESIALIPTRAGTFELPEIQIPWWNKEQEQIEYAVLAARTLTVKAAPQGSSAEMANMPPANIPVPNTRDTIPPASATVSFPLFWILVCAALAVCWLATLYLLLNTRRKLSLLTGKHAHTAPEENRLREKEAYGVLNRSCRDNEPAAARKAVMTWLQTLLPETRIQTFADVEKNIDSLELVGQLKELDKILFDQANSTSWTGKELLQAATKLRGNQRKPVKNTDVLEELYK